MTIKCKMCRPILIFYLEYTASAFNFSISSGQLVIVNGVRPRTGNKDDINPEWWARFCHVTQQHKVPIGGIWAYHQEKEEIL